MLDDNTHIDNQMGNLTLKYDKVHYESIMRFDQNDMKFVMIAVALQVARQWLSEKIVDRGRLENQAAAKEIKHSTSAKKIAQLNYGEWILGPTSYDAIQRTPGEKRRINQPGISGRNHRYKTLGHDPFIGLLVGPINLMSNTLTRNDFATYKTKPISLHSASTGYLISTPMPGGIIGATTEALNNGISDPKFAAAAVVKHLIHLASDVNTIQGLPIPGAGALLPDNVNDWLLGNGFDAIWFANIGMQAGLSQMINTITSVTYSWLLYDEKKYGSHEVFNEKVKKVVAVANAISASANLMRVGLDIAEVNWIEALKHLDIGGLIIAIKAMMNSGEFKKQIHDMIYAFDDIKFGLTVSVADIQAHYERQSLLIDNEFEQVLLEMNAEYDRLDGLMENAINLEGRSIDQFTAAIKLAQYVKVDESKIIHNQDEGDGYFLN